MSDLPAYRFGPRREGSLFGLAPSQTVVIAASVVLALVAILAARAPLIGLVTLGIGAVFAFCPVAGRSAVTWLGPICGQFTQQHRGTAQRASHLLRPEGGIAPDDEGGRDRVTWHLPGLGRLVVRNVEMKGIRLGVAQFGTARHGASFTLSLAGPRFGLTDAIAQSRALDSWGQLLGTVARSNGDLERIELVERVVPDDLAAEWAFLAQIASVGDRRARAIYRAELDELAGEAIHHEVLLTAVLTRAGRRVEEAAASACAALMDQLDAAGFSASPLDAASLTESLRQGLDPVSATALAVENDGMLDALRHAPGSWRADWGSIAIDGSLHACFEASALPRVPVGPDWAWPIVLPERPVTRRVLALHVELVRPDIAIRHAERAVVAHESDEALRSKWGFRSGARRDQELSAALAREAELAEGFAAARFALLLDIAAPTTDELNAGCRAVTSQAAQGHIELRRLYGHQANALVATLPLGVTRFRGGWR